MLNRRSVLFLVLALIFGFSAMLLTRAYLARASMAPIVEELELVDVAVAARDLSVGTALQEQDLTLVSWPKTHLPANFFETKGALRDRVLRHAVRKGDPIFGSILLPEGSASGLISMIEDGHRAVSVKVDAVVGVAGFVKPGARVDVLATLRRTNNTNFSNVVLQNVKVLAVDQSLEEAKNGEPQVVNVVTLEVEPVEAERLIHAAHEGKLQLALRNPGDEERVSSKAVQAGDLFGTVAKKPRKKRVVKQRDFIELIKGTERSESEISEPK